jgi:hypothetical protein
MYLLDLFSVCDPRPSVAHVYEILSTEIFSPVTYAVKIMKIIVFILIIIETKTSWIITGWPNMKQTGSLNVT